MEREPDAAGALYGGAPAATAQVAYPYGLRLNFTHEELEKLGYTELPPAGTEIHLEARGVVVRAATEDPDADGDIDYCCVEVQIKELGMEQEGETEEEEGEDTGRAERMYKKGEQKA